MCWPSIWELKGDRSRDLGRGCDGGPKAHEKDTQRSTVGQELHGELVENRAKSMMRQPPLPSWEKQENGQKGLNHSDGEG